VTTTTAPVAQFSIRRKDFNVTRTLVDLDDSQVAVTGRDDTVFALVSHAHKKVINETSKVIGVATTSMHGSIDLGDGTPSVRRSDSPHGHLACDALMWYCREVGFNTLGVLINRASYYLAGLNHFCRVTITLTIHPF
jgi:2',3'-cyclic-nucleotide 2'-phosphodiesterase (5'-nucleotidase family)